MPKRVFLRQSAFVHVSRSLVSVSVAVSLAGLLCVCIGVGAGCSSTPGASVADGSVPTPTDAATNPAPDSATGVDATARDAEVAPTDASPDGASADGSMQDATTPDAADAADAAVAPMGLTSATLSDNGRFPVAHTCNGVNKSPALTWTDGPPGTNSYAVVMKDLTVPNKHWTLYDIPASARSIGASVPNGYTPAAPAPAGSKHGTVTFSPTTFGYLGPCPPVGDHDYIFTVYALSGATLAGAAQTDSPDTLESKILAQKVSPGAEASLRSKYMQP